MPPKPIFARFAFLLVAQAELDSGLYEHPRRPFIDEDSAEHLASEARRASLDCDRLGATAEQWSAMQRWLRESCS